MHTLLVILGIHSVLFGFALTFAGFVTLATPDNEEIEEQRKAYEAERGKGRLNGFLFGMGQVSAARGRALEMAISHWPKRPQSRKLIYAGVACLLIAAVIGYYLDVFKS